MQEIPWSTSEDSVLSSSSGSRSWADITEEEELKAAASSFTDLTTIGEKKEKEKVIPIPRVSSAPIPETLVDGWTTYKRSGRSPNINKSDLRSNKSKPLDEVFSEEMEDGTRLMWTNKAKDCVFDLYNRTAFLVGTQDCNTEDIKALFYPETIYDAAVTRNKHTGENHPYAIVIFKNSTDRNLYLDSEKTVINKTNSTVISMRPIRPYLIRDNQDAFRIVIKGINQADAESMLRFLGPIKSINQMEGKTTVFVTYNNNLSSYLACEMFNGTFWKDTRKKISVEIYSKR
jgi:hypothetical protein